MTLPTTTAHDRRHQAYAALERLSAEVQAPAVVIVVDAAHTESHVQISAPGVDDLEALKLLGQKALYALNLYLMQIDDQLAAAHGPQSAQGGVSVLRTELQFLCDVSTTFVVAAVREDAAGLFQDEIHVCKRPIIQSGHGATFPSAGLKQHPLRATGRLQS